MILNLADCKLLKFLFNGRFLLKKRQELFEASSYKSIKLAEIQLKHIVLKYFCQPVQACIYIKAVFLLKVIRLDRNKLLQIIQNDCLILIIMNPCLLSIKTSLLTSKFVN